MRSPSSSLSASLFSNDLALEAMIFLQPPGANVDKTGGIDRLVLALHVHAHQLLVVEGQWGLLAEDVHLALEQTPGLSLLLGLAMQ